MAGSVNKVTLIGNLGNDPEVRSTSIGKEIASLSLATTESWKDQSGERQSKTEWHRVAVYNEGLVRVVKNYLKKGAKIYIEGTLRTRKWQDQNGQDRYTTEVALENYSGQLVMLDRLNSEGGGSNAGGGSSFNDGASNNNPSFGQMPSNDSGAAAANYQDAPIDDDIPF